jgi:hypothetical protein
LWLNRSIHARKKESNLPLKDQRTRFTKKC